VAAVLILEQERRLALRKEACRSKESILAPIALVPVSERTRAQGKGLVLTAEKAGETAVVVIVARAGETAAVAEMVGGMPAAKLVAV